jgi:ATP-dependent RNA helicase RhlE
VRSEAIHGDRSQQQRDRALQSFKSGKARVLVATDVVARGIDIDKITHVVNYDVPHTAEEYVHRIGRTARAGEDGAAISFLSTEELDKFTAIERSLDTVLACEDLEGFRYKERTVPDPERTSKRTSGGSGSNGRGSKGRSSNGRNSGGHNSGGNGSGNGRSGRMRRGGRNRSRGRRN